MDICSLWTQEGHLEVDDILALPMFATTLGTLAIQGNSCGQENFRALYRLDQSPPSLFICSKRLDCSAVTLLLWRS
jgi:hypothetical protein